VETNNKPKKSFGEMIKQSEKLHFTLISIALVFVILLVYGQVRNHEFVNFDDNYFIYNNPYIQEGLTRQSIAWAFHPVREVEQMGFWHPLTSLSLILDVELFGLNAGAHHLMNAAYHIVNTLLLLFLLRSMTGQLWPSVFVAALFALHPQHVESVAWASERKDVLSTFFLFLTLIAYTRYAKHPTILRYLQALVLFALGLMAKSMLVTVPFVLLLLDYWPLRRLRTAGTDLSLQPFGSLSVPRLILEKIPFFILTVIVCVIMIFAQRAHGALAELGDLSIRIRVFNAFIAYTAYLEKFFLPFNLCAYYPLDIKAVTLSRFLLALVVLGLLTGVILCFPKRRYLTTGWFWYLGTLVPVIGFVQIGAQAMADRYTYIPHIGLAMLAAWGAADLFGKNPYRRQILTAVSVLLLLLFSIASQIQVGTWRNSITLFTQAINAVPNNYFAHKLMAYTLQNQKQYDLALEHYDIVMKVAPSVDIQHNIGTILLQQGKFNEVIALYEKILPPIPENAPPITSRPLKYSPEYELLRTYGEGHTNLATALEETGNLPEAIRHYLEALRIMPTSAKACYNLARALAKNKEYEKAVTYFRALQEANQISGEMYTYYGIALLETNKTEEAQACFENAISLAPNAPLAYYHMGNILFSKGQIDQAIEQYNRAITISPEWTGLRDRFARMIAAYPQSKYYNPTQAVLLAQQICEQIQYQFPEPLDTLAIAYASEGNFSKAIETAQQAAQLADKAGKQSLAGEIRQRLELYQNGKAFHLPSPDQQTENPAK
jgi:tetratricopeptide (TPR) repeat protein